MNCEVCSQVFRAIETLEVGANIAGYIPIVGSLSSQARRMLAVAEVTCGFVMAIFAVGLLAQGNPAAGITFSISVALMGHSALNTIRSLFECFPLVPWVTCLPYDIASQLLLGRRIFRYPA